MMARKYGHHSIIKYLIEHGADVHTKVNDFENETESLTSLEYECITYDNNFALNEGTFLDESDSLLNYLLEYEKDFRDNFED